MMTSDSISSAGEHRVSSKRRCQALFSPVAFNGRLSVRSTRCRAAQREQASGGRPRISPRRAWSKAWSERQTGARQEAHPARCSRLAGHGPSESWWAQRAINLLPRFPIAIARRTNQIRNLRLRARMSLTVARGRPAVVRESSARCEANARRKIFENRSSRASYCWFARTRASWLCR